MKKQEGRILILYKNKKFKKNIDDIKRRTGEAINKEITKLDDRLYNIEEDKQLKVRWYQRLWAKLNNKKTAIGATIALLGIPVSLANSLIGQTMMWTGGVIGGIGGVHKVAKVQTTYGEKGKFGLEEILKIAIDILNKILIFLKK